MSAGPVERFSRVRALLLVVRECEHILDSTGSIEARDEAATICVKAETDLLAELNILQAAGTLDEISKFLEITYGGGN